MSLEYPHIEASRRKKYPEDDNKDDNKKKKRELMEIIKYGLYTLKELMKKPTPKI